MVRDLHPPGRLDHVHNHLVLRCSWSSRVFDVSIKRRTQHRAVPRSRYPEHCDQHLGDGRVGCPGAGG